MALYSLPSLQDFNHWCWGSGKTYVLLNITKHQQLYVDKIYLYVKDAFESKYQLLINRITKVGIEHPKAFIDHSQTIDNVYENLDDHNFNKKKISVNSFWWYDIRSGS